jgi:hypothetical protein
MSSLFGFSYNNDAGKVTVDSDHINLAVLQRGQFGGYLALSQSQPDNRHGVRVQVRYPTPVTSQIAPIVAFVPRRNCNGHWHCFQHTGGPGNWTGFDVSFMERYPGEVVSYYYQWFAPTSLPMWDWVVANSEGMKYSPEMFGLRVWDELGRLAFDSGTQVMKILRVITQWGQFYNYPQWRSYAAPWPYTANGQYGFIASNLPCQSIFTSYAPFISPRFGFTAASLAGGQVQCHVGGPDANAEDSIYTLVSGDYVFDDTMNNWMARNPIQLFVVKVQ